MTIRKMIKIPGALPKGLGVKHSSDEDNKIKAKAKLKVHKSLNKIKRK